LKDYTGRRREIEIDSKVDTILDLVGYLDQLYPGIKRRILDDQDITRQYVNIFLNGEELRFFEKKENTRLKEGDLVHILPSVAGG
jgi:molybdopterin synthase sulfur carrier subunit